MMASIFFMAVERAFAEKRLAFWYESKQALGKGLSAPPRLYEVESLC
ncbi:MAG: hypothetical protein ACYDD1_07550 [Caulobacteraceae bacterium]